MVDVLRERLPPFLNGITSAPLTEFNVNAIPQGAKGAYLLLHHDRPVYVGKTDAKHGFRDRLMRHYYTLQDRVGIGPEEMSFKAVRILVFSIIDVEAILIETLRRQDPGALSWNNSGFGSNDPGDKRDGQEPAEFDRQYPIDVDRQLRFDVAGQRAVLDLLKIMRANLPYVLRFDTKSPRLIELRDVHIALPQGPTTTRRVLQTVIEALPAGWQATIFPGRIILYPRQTTYPFALATIP